MTTSPGPHTPPSADRAPPRVKCLLVDDLPANLVALSALLEREDVELLQARSGREALELLLEHEVGLAFIDVQMPEMDGFELAELMRGSERSRHVPIIFVTAGTHDQQRIFQGYDSGAVDFLFKPIEAHILESKAEVFIALHRQKQQQAELLRERTETLRLQEMFTAVLGHDLRGPLSAILMAAQLLKARPEESVRRTGDRLQQSGRWMSRMIEDMLDLSRLRLGGGIVLDRQPIELADLLERVVQERREAAPQRHITLQIDGDTRGDWDADRLAQLAANLVGNAVVHGDAGQAVAVSLDGRDPGCVVLGVANGGSIPLELQPHVFDPFRSGRERSNRAEGLGLGLYIVQQIVRAHQGQVALRSDPRIGTLFLVTLPRHA
jgi:two-component system, sensor histidine kinase and response regulator